MQPPGGRMVLKLQGAGFSWILQDSAFQSIQEALLPSIQDRPALCRALPGTRPHEDSPLHKQVNLGSRDTLEQVNSISCANARDPAFDKSCRYQRCWRGSLRRKSLLKSSHHWKCFPLTQVEYCLDKVQPASQPCNASAPWALTSPSSFHAASHWRVIAPQSLKPPSFSLPQRSLTEETKLKQRGYGSSVS